MTRLFSVLGADSDAQRQAIKNAGCTHAIIRGDWLSLQPTATGTLDATAQAKLLADIDHAVSIGLKPILSINLHYCPAWALAEIEPYTDQLGNQYLDTSTSDGKAVRNWAWTTTGRTRVSDLINRVSTALGPARIAQVDGVRLPLGWYGELNYPQPVAGGPTYAWQGFGASMQNGTGLAAGTTVCPSPGYVPYSGTLAQTLQWVNWYLNGLHTFMAWVIELFKSQGFNRRLWALLPGYGVRYNNDPAGTAYQSAASLGQDHIRAIGELMSHRGALPYSTWLDTSDGFAGGTADSDKSAWKSIVEKALVRGMAVNLVGENTGGEDNTGMDAIVAGALGSATYAGSIGVPTTGHYYSGMIWLDNGSLTGGVTGNADLAHYQSVIAAAPA